MAGIPWKIDRAGFLTAGRKPFGGGGVYLLAELRPGRIVIIIDAPGAPPRRCGAPNEDISE
jgi:hypothetical protein